MVTITQTIEEMLPTREIKLRRQPRKTAAPLPQQPQQLTCPPDCSCRQQTLYTKYMPYLFNAIGIIIAMFATYVIISTDSTLYLVFWVFYSVLRRMMSKSKSRSKAE